MKKVTTAVIATATLVLTPAVAVAQETEATPTTCADTSELTILATTDNHGTALNYDYFTGEPFGGAGEQGDTRGLELLAPAIADIREEKGAESVLLVDNGDSNQGNPLATVYHANRTDGSVDPMAAVLNYLDYEAGVVGNHEFNYGQDDLAQYASNLEMPLLGANVLDRESGEPRLTPYTLIDKTVDGQDVTVGVIGVVTPGVRIWDSARVTDLRFQDTVEAVQKWVPVVREAGADVVVVLAHTGVDAVGYKWDPADLTENAARSIAENTSGVDVIIGGHSHVEDNYNTTYTNAAGESVLLSQPGYHGRFLSEVTVPLVFGDDGSVDVVNTAECAPTGTPHYASDYVGREDTGVAEAIADWHAQTLEWVAQEVATATEDMPAATSAWEDTAILDFISEVQTQTVRDALVGTEYADHYLISQASPFSRTAIFNEGPVTVADMAALYVYDNTLLGVELTGAQIKDYLEWSARYYTQQEEGAEITDWATVTNALYEGETRGVRDYAYDVLTGLNYHINISKPVGERIENLTYPDGSAIGDDDLFVLAINNYRQSGGSSYPHVASAPIVYDEALAIRDLMIEWPTKYGEGVINPDDFFVANWTVGTSSVAEEVPPVSDDEQGDAGQPGADTGEGSDNSGSTDGQTETDAETGAAKQPTDAEGELAQTGTSTVTISAVALILMLVGAALAYRARRV